MISNLKTVFGQMVKAQEKVGFDDTQGIQQTLKDSIYIAETSASDLSWLTKDDAQALAISLATMRRYQAEFMHRRATESRNAFMTEADNFKAVVDKIVAADIMKSSVLQRGEVLCRRVPELGRRSADRGPQPAAHPA